MRHWAPDPLPEGLHLAVARAEEVPSDEAWLTPAERTTLEALSVEKRVHDWRLGRWVAKAAVAKALGKGDPASCDTEILADASGRPTARVAGVPLADLPHISLSHSADRGFAAAWFGAGDVGCDVEAVAPRSAEFLESYFTDTERARMAESELPRDLVTNLLWSAKESALKALGRGLREDTRAVEVSGVGWPNRGGHWAALEVTGPAGARFEGAWRELEGFVWTVVVGPVEEAP